MPTLFPGGNHPPFIANTSISSQISQAYREGTEWGIQVGTAMLGLFLIAAVLKLLVSKV